MVDLDRLTQVFELASYVVVVLGVPIGLVQYVRAKQRERAEREYHTFDAVSASYVDFLRLCLDHPELDVFDLGDERPAPLNPTQQKQELIALAILFSIFERAYLLYADRPTPNTERQWREWDVQLRDYFRRPNFRRAWSLGTSSYDPRFVAYMVEVERQVRATGPDRTGAGVAASARERPSPT